MMMMLTHEMNLGKRRRQALRKATPDDPNHDGCLLMMYLTSDHGTSYLTGKKFFIENFLLSIFGRFLIELFSTEDYSIICCCIDCQNDFEKVLQIVYTC